MAAPILPNEKSSQSLSSYEYIHDSNDQPSHLGTGSFATVRLARDKRTGKSYALKMVDINPAKATKADLYYLRTEIQIHRQLDHPNVVKFHDYIQEDVKLYFVLDYAENGNLYNYIQSKKVLTPNEVFNFFYQTCLAVEYCHQNDVFHRDIKPENILVDKDLNVKLCDFGWSARSIYEQRTTFCGTYEYMAPEIVWGQPYDYRIDIWSLGILLYELVHKEAPYKGRTLPEIADSLTRPTLVFSTSIQPEVRDLIEKILKIEPHERISISEILSHPWVRYHLTKREYTQNQANALKPKSRQDSSLSPRFKQNFYMGQVQIAAKAPTERNPYFPEQSVELKLKQEQSVDLSPTIQVPTTVEPPKYAQGNNQQSNTSTDSPQDTLRKENQPSMAKKPEKYDFDKRKHSGDSGTRKLFEKDIMSPDFNLKLNSVLAQLNVNTSHRRNATGLMTGILSPQSQNSNNIPKHNRINSTFGYGNENSSASSLPKQPGMKENVQNMTYDFANISLNSSKLKNDQENFKPTPRGYVPTPRAHVNPSNMRLDTLQLREQVSNGQMTTLRMNIKVKPENGKLQKHIVLDAGYYSQNSVENYLNSTALNSTHDTSANSFSKNVKFEGKTLNGGYTGSLANGSNIHKKSAFKSFENMISKGVGGCHSTKNKENRGDTMRENWTQNDLYSQR